MITYSIDPGKHESSVAVGVDNQLVFVLRADSAEQGWSHIISKPARIVLEVPRSYPKTAGQANDLIDEVVQGALIAGRIAQATGGSVHIVHPSTTTEAGRKGWKGQVPKPLHHRRIMSALRPEEQKILLAIKPDLWQYIEAACERYTTTRKVTGYKALIHNDLDAVGIFLEDCGRIK